MPSGGQGETAENRRQGARAEILPSGTPSHQGLAEEIHTNSSQQHKRSETGNKTETVAIMNMRS